MCKRRGEKGGGGEGVCVGVCVCGEGSGDQREDRCCLSIPPTHILYIHRPTGPQENRKNETTHRPVVCGVELALHARKVLVQGDEDHHLLF